MEKNRKTAGEKLGLQVVGKYEGHGIGLNNKLNKRRNFEIKYKSLWVEKWNTIPLERKGLAGKDEQKLR